LAAIPVETTVQSDLDQQSDLFTLHASIVPQDSQTVAGLHFPRPMVTVALHGFNFFFDTGYLWSRVSIGDIDASECNAGH